MRKTNLILCTAILVGCGYLEAGLNPFSKNRKVELDKSKVGDGPSPAPQPSPAPNPPPQPVPTPPLPEQPELILPPQVDGDVGSFIKVVAQTNGEHVRWLPLDKGLAVFPSEMLKDSTQTVVMSAIGGTYRLLAYTAVGDIPSDPVQTMVVVHGAQPPPVPPPVPQPVPVNPTPPPPDPAPVTSVPTASKLWIVLLYSGNAVKGGSSDPLAGILNNQSMWNGFKAAGHQYKKVDTDKDSDVNNFKVQIAANGGVPCVVIMDAASNHPVLNTAPGEMRVPDNSGGTTSSAKFQDLINRHVSP